VAFTQYEALLGAAFNLMVTTIRKFWWMSIFISYLDDLSKKCWQEVRSIQSRLKVSLREAPKPAFLMCIGGWCQPMIEVELPYLLDFFFSYP
jgi:hypothetical protein